MAVLRYSIIIIQWKYNPHILTTNSLYHRFWMLLFLSSSSSAASASSPLATSCHFVLAVVILFFIQQHILTHFSVRFGEKSHHISEKRTDFIDTLCAIRLMTIYAQCECTLWLPPSPPLRCYFAAVYFSSLSVRVLSTLFLLPYFLSSSPA